MNTWKRDLLQKKIIYEELVGIVGKENVHFNEVDALCYSRDTWQLLVPWIKGGGELPKPDFIVHPENTKQVSEIVKLANRFKIPLIPFGGGAGVCGGTIPVNGGIIVDLKKMNKILNVDHKSLLVTVQPGIFGEVLERELNKMGYTLPHYPASMYCSTVGGFVACRSAGSLSSKYGKIEDMVVGLEVVTPTGEILRMKPVPRSSTGPDLKQLFIGSEGTLGIITEVTLKIKPLPEERRFKAFIFKDLHSGIESVIKIFRKGIKPCVVRLYDYLDAQFTLKGRAKIPEGGSYLILGFDGLKEIVELEERIATEICLNEGGVEVDKELAEYWWNHRYDMYYPDPLRSSYNIIADTVDVAATYDKLEELYWEIKKTVETKNPGVTMMAHFSHFYEDGGSIYMIFFTQQQGHEKAVEVYSAVWRDALEACLRVGGTISHHHGIGVVRAGWMHREHGEAFEVLKTIKKALDPNNIMNPGKLGF
ncbi:MAG: FAD-binding oxidoreductase [Candidatus Jordarchaeales archaeon]